MRNTAGIILSTLFTLPLQWAAAATYPTDFTVEELGDDCADFDYAVGLFSIVADSARYAINGNRDVAVPVNENTTSTGYVGIHPRTDIAAPALYCENGNLFIWVDDDDADAQSYSQLVIAELDDGKISLMFGVEGEAVRAYAHYDADGDRIPGVFLGVNNSTTWEIMYRQSEMLYGRSDGYYHFWHMQDKDAFRTGDRGFLRARHPDLDDVCS